MNTPVTPHDLFVMICTCMRDALRNGKNNGSVHTVARLFRDYGRGLSESDRKQLLNEIVAERQSWYLNVVSLTVSTQQEWDRLAGEIAKTLP